MNETKELDQTYLAATYARFDLEITHGQGATAYDEAGKAYLDFGAGIGVNALGYSDKGWQAAVTAQLAKVQHTSNLYYTAPQAHLAQALCQRTGMKKVFFSNSGAEANECAIKAARKYAFDKYGPERNVILTLVNSFHGRTLATLSATGQDSFHQYFGPLVPGFRYVEANNPQALEAAVDDNVCAILFEPIQGEGGVTPLTKEFVDKLFALAAEHDILTIADEVQTGNGRTGTLYAYMHYGVLPDIVSTAKGLGGGLPFGATLLGNKVKDTLTAGNHGSTFGGNPVCAAGALYILSQLNEPLFEQVRQKGAWLKASLEGSPNVISVTGMGLMWGIETTKDAKEVAAQCLNKGLIVLTAKNKIRLLPPLCISQTELEQGINQLKEVLAK